MVVQEAEEVGEQPVAKAEKVESFSYDGDGGGRGSRGRDGGSIFRGGWSRIG